MLFYIIAYDIPCDKRRRKVAELLEGYGRRVQYSVFECVLAQSKYLELQKRLKKQENLTEDKLRFYTLSLNSDFIIKIPKKNKYKCMNSTTNIL